jgi:cytidine deaminase
MKGLHILVHNLSHSDLVVEIENVMARPKFSNFREVSELLLKSLELRNDDDESLSNVSYFHPYNRESRSYDETSSIPVGFELKENYSVTIPDQAGLRFKEDYSDRKGQPCIIDCAYFPLVAILLPKWLKSIEDNMCGGTTKKILVLVSGRGTPSDASANVSDNSTEYLGKMILLFISKVYPDLHIKLLHSKTNLFRYDENIMFVKHELLPLIDSYRDDLFRSVGIKWKECMKLCLSFADGSSARINAMNASLKYYRPSYMHFWQLKTFWRGKQICEDDIEGHTYEEIATEPATALIGTSNLDNPQVLLVVNEMNAFRKEFHSLLSNPNIDNDLSSFWLRKTRKPVLAVLLVQKEDGPPMLYRGTNMEVSMPTGSLCAERNVIGSALAADITLKRQDIKLIAVYSATIPSPEATTCGVCSIDAESSSSSEQSSSSRAMAPALDGTMHGTADERDPFPSLSSSSSSSAHHFERTSMSPPPPAASLMSSKKPKLIAVQSMQPPVAQDSPGTSEDGGSRSRSDSYSSSGGVPLLRPNYGMSPSKYGQGSNLPLRNPSLPLMAPPSATIPSHVPGAGTVLSSGSVLSPTSLLLMIPPVPTGGLSSYGLTPRSGIGQGQPLQEPSAYIDSPPSIGDGTPSIGDGTPSGGQRRKMFLNHNSRLSLPASSSARGDWSPRSNGDSNGKDSGFNRGSNGGDTKATTHPDGNGSLLPAPGSKRDTDFMEGMGGSKSHVGTNTSGSDADSRSEQRSPLKKQRKRVEGKKCIATMTIDVDPNDMNPLKPCGACHEWLKKIAEMNPHLKVITFTDVDCHGMYIERVDD